MWLFCSQHFLINETILHIPMKNEDVSSLATNEKDNLCIDLNDDDATLCISAEIKRKWAQVIHEDKIISQSKMKKELAWIEKC